MKKAEILAPCGSMESLYAALRTGCDAVYLGGTHFSARQNAANFNDAELLQAVKECHTRGVKVYQAINTVITDEQLEECVQAVRRACDIGVDGLITQDLALVEIVNECCPDMEIHASTQMTLHTRRGVLQAKMLGFSRAVVSRELSGEIIRQLCRLPIEIEVFVHGALCMSVSGQCYMSAVIGSRSANRGLCAQACRLPCTALKNQPDRHDLSLKDMSYAKHISQLEKYGAASLKIEGRMKRPEYVAAAVDAVRKARDGEAYDIARLEKVFSRDGFTDGYYTAKTGRDMFGFRRREDVASSAEVIPALHELYRREYKRAQIYFYVRIAQGEQVYVCASDENGISAEVYGDLPQTALNRPADEEYLKKQFSKLGDTIYSFGGLNAEIGEGLTVPAAALNALRRTACSALDEKRFESNTKRPDFKITDFHIEKQTKPAKPEIRISISRPEQLRGLDADEIGLIICSPDTAQKLLDSGFSAEKLAAEMPRFTFDEEKDFERLKALAQNGLKHMVCTNYAHISMGVELSLVMHGGFGLNVTNSLALRTLRKMGLCDCTASFELKAGQINALGGELDFGIIGYGRLPLMLTANCPVKQASGCSKCSGTVWDRTGRAFPVKCSRKNGYVEILNSDVLYIGDRMTDFTYAKFVRLDFYEETPEQVCGITEKFMRGEKPENIQLTRGLYYRGII